MEHLTKKLVLKNCENIWAVASSLRGLSGLFNSGARDICFDDEELFGIGQLLRKLGDDLQVIEDVLKCGEDSMVEQRHGIDEDDEEDEDRDEDGQCFDDNEKSIAIIMEHIKKLAKS